MPAVHGVGYGGFEVVGFQRIRFFPPADAAFQNVPQQNTHVLRLLHRHLAVCAVRVPSARPIQALAVLCAHQGAVDKDRLHTKLFADLRFDGRRHALVVLVQEEIRLVLVPRNAVIQKQLPADAAGLSLAVLGLRDAPVCAGASTN